MCNRVIPDRTKYPFRELDVNQSAEIEADYRLVRISADGFRKRNNKFFLVSKIDNKVKITRYK